MNGSFIPYGRQAIDDEDLKAVVEVLQSDWLTTGPAVGRFEDAFSSYVGAAHGIAVSNGTAALHLCMLAAGVAPGDEVIVPALTFVASANCARYVGATVRFADVRVDTLTIDPAHVESLISSRTRAIVAVDYAGVPCDLDELMLIANRHGLTLISDACHAPGATYRKRNVGSIAHMSTFSFHPVKHLTTGEGGMITTSNLDLADLLRSLRNHGIDSDFRAREEQGTWEYDMSKLGFNFRLSDINAALGASQMRKMPMWVGKRREIAAWYREDLGHLGEIILPFVPDDREASWHLFPVRINGANPEQLRRVVFQHLRSVGIGVNVHYRPVYLNSYYASLGYERGLCPVAEHAYSGLLSLPMWPGLSRDQQQRVTSELEVGLRSGGASE